MAVRIGHASLSENGTINGKKGDSTKNEVCARTWYKKPWDYMAIHPDEAVREKHAAAVEAACANNMIGYGQSDRNTAHAEAKKVNMNLAAIANPCNCDCSSLMNLCALISGAKGVTYASNGWTTRNMLSKLKAAGYKIIDDELYLSNEKYCVRGAIYVKAGSHTVAGLDNGANYRQTLAFAGIHVESAPTVSTPKGPVEVVNSQKKATEPAKSKDSSMTGTYEVTASSLHIRNGCGTNKTSLGTLPRGTKVKCYGYYTKSQAGTNWLLVQTTYKGTKYTGFCSGKYLAKK